MEEDFSTILEQKFDSWNNYINSLSNHLNPLTTLHVNIRSIIKNFAQLELILGSSPRIPDVIILTEANIKNENVNLFNLDSYNMYVNLRKTRKGGGVIMYVHNSITFERMKCTTLYSELILGKLILPNRIECGHMCYL